MATSTRDQAVLQLLQAAALAPAELDSFVERALDISWWRERAPNLSIEAQGPPDGAPNNEPSPLSSADLAEQAGQLEREGFFQTASVLERSVVEHMRQCVEGLILDRWPPVFGFVYDEFWRVMRTPSLKRLITGFLGEGYRQNALVWTFHVPAVRGAGGWAPHSDDSLRLSRSRLTVWIPLSESTVENGCMYVIPRDRMPATIPAGYGDIESVTHEQLNALLQTVKALPSPPGALLGWDHDLIHWGSMSTGRTRARISIAAEFIAGAQKPKVGELPLIDSSHLPSFPERIRIIGNAIVEYGRVEPLMRKYRSLGSRLANA